MTTPAATLTAPRARRNHVQPLPGEDRLWEQAPLVDGVRDLHTWPEPARAAMVEHYLPLQLRRLRLFASSVEHHLPDPADARAQATLWLLEDMTRYDPRRGVPFAGYVIASLPTHVHALARGGACGRYVADSELHLARVGEEFLRTHGREPSLADWAATRGETLAEITERARAVALRRGLRSPIDLGLLDAGALPLSADGALWAARAAAPSDDPLADLIAAEDATALTYAIVFAAWNAEPEATGEANIAGLWALLLETFGGYCRSDLARAAHCNARAIVASESALIASTRDRLGTDVRPG